MTVRKNGQNYPKSRIRKIHIREFTTKKTFYELAAPFSAKEGTVILLSGGEQDNSKYNILAAEPWMKISSKGTGIYFTERGRTTEISGDPLELMKEVISNLSDCFKTITFENEELAELPVSAGLFGYLSYDMKDHIEEISRTTVDDLMLPDLYMISPQLIVIENKISGKIHTLVVELDFTESDEIESLFKLVTAADKSIYSPDSFSIPPGNSIGNFESNFDKTEYLNSISDIIDYIKQGDIYQVNMSQRFSTDFSGSAYALYTELFQENPAPFFAYLNCGDHQIVSTSPERFILQDGNRVEARPIKGTRPRGKSPVEDERLRKELQASPKDAAELSMIVDLLRNDIGKVCKGGSVKVLEHKTLAAYKNVYHMISTIEGYLEEDKDSVDLIRAAFPGGSITGCPKIRSMEIIDEKEPFRRHIYTGSIGYIGFNERMDLSIVIRTATITGGKVLFSVGGGIVYDSDPPDEYDETLHKAQSLMRVMNRHVKIEGKQVDSLDKTAIPFPGEFYCWTDGKFLIEKNSMIPGMSKGYQYGKGVFETLKVVKGNIEYLEEHIKRIKEGCRIILGMELPGIDWKDVADILIKMNQLDESAGVMKIMISEGRTGLFGDANIIVTCRKYEERTAIKKNGGLTLGIYPNKRESYLADYKTFNYLFYLKAGEWAKDNGFDEAVIVNADGSVSETNTGNLLIIRDKTVIVPESPHRLPGIMESKVLGDYKTKDYTISRKKIFPGDLFNTKTILVTNSLIGAVKGKLEDGEGRQETGGF